MFKTKTTVTTNQRIQQLEAALKTMRVISEFFGPIELREGEATEDLIARCLGITRFAYDENLRLFRSIVAGRVIPREQ